ncbi:MAG: NAD(P)H-hydrate dehydratase [Candidatus Omnitrophota bacterium]
MRLPKRKLDTHKGDYGFVLVAGGSPGLTGAVCLCANAALRIGAGLVKAAVPQSLYAIFEIKLTESMTLPLADKGGCFCKKSFKDLSGTLDRIDTISIGPGAGCNTETKEFFYKIIEEIDKPIVIDADALNALAENIDILKRRKSKRMILTPHLGEFSRLTGISADKIKRHRKELAKKFALKYNLVLVLKGQRTIVTDGRKLYENRTGNPGMATAGSGDVLTGIISGLLAQGIDVFDAAKLGVYLHGLSGDLAAKDKTQYCLIASDIIDYLPKAIKFLHEK